MNHFIVDGKYKALLTQFGMDVTEILRRAELPTEILNRKTILMEEEQYYRFMKAIGECIGDEHTMLKLALADRIETFSPPIFAAWCSQNGEACIERLATYKKLIGPMTWTLTEEGKTVGVTVEAGEPKLRLPTFLVQSDFAFLLGMLRKATEEKISPVGIFLTEKPLSDALSEYAECKVETGLSDSIVFRRADLEKPFLSFNPAMWDYFEPEMNRRLSDLEVDDSTSARVRRALSELLPSGACGIEDVAQKLGLSRRTLQRKLSEEKTTFQKQLNSAREALAIHYIRNTDMTAADVAFLLGYAELNSFLRAFSVRTGKSLTEYRNEQEKQ